MRAVIRFFPGVLLALSLFFSGIAAERVALVIGNDEYPEGMELNNASRDATAVGERLRQGGYKVTTLTDGSIRESLKSLLQFREASRDAEVALFFYAGHGIEVDGQNYLLPVDAKLTERVDLDLETLSLDRVLREMTAGGARLKIIVLDCCRNNPLSQTRSWIKRTRSTAGGLAEVGQETLAEGTMLVFSAAPGTTALDGRGAHSPFTRALLDEMAGGNSGISTIFSRVAKAVENQEPWIKFDGSGRSFAAFSEFGLLDGVIPVAPGAAPRMKVPLKDRRTGPLLRVPSQFSSIQNAVDAALEGDTILIGSGIYYETVKVIKRHKIEIRGENRDTTILRCRIPSTCLEIEDSSGILVSNLSFEFRGEEIPTHNLSEEKRTEMFVRPYLINGTVSETVIEKCRFNGRNGVSGVVFQGLGNRVTGCEFDKCILGIKYCGYEDHPTSGLIESNKVANALGTGIISCCNARTRMIGNTSENNFYSGIAACSTVEEVSDNYCFENRLHGIMIIASEGDQPPPGHRVQVEDNRLERNVDSGITMAEGAVVNLTGNRCNLNDRFGIVARDGAIAAISDNFANNNGDSGIWAYGASTKPSITGNTASDNARYGIMVEKRTYPTGFSGNITIGNSRANVERNAILEQ